MKKPASRPVRAPARTPVAATGRVRLIGGRWRGTRLPVPDLPGLRPSADRVRETLFNWLMPVLPGARVLDLFAGSGALGLEAVSRGAASAVLVERDRALAQSLREVTARLPGGDAVQVVQADAQVWLPGQGGASFDIAFLDPPFADDAWERILPPLLPALAADAWLYLEAPRERIPALPGQWLPHRQGSTREVQYALYRREAKAAPDPQ